MTPRRRPLFVVAIAYGTALVALGFARYILAMTPSAQFAIAMATVLIAVLILARVNGITGAFWTRRRGKAMIANGATLAVAGFVTLAIQQSLPDAWPLAAIGLVLPALLIAELGIDWTRLDGTKRIAG